MPDPLSLRSVLGLILGVYTAAPASADGEILITQAKALAGNVTPGDTAGFPVTLSLPGTYQFASNILPTANVAGIYLAQRNITVDLNGFELHGGGVANHGIVGVHDGATIKNGTITGFQYDGINGAGRYWIIENVRSVGNGRDGIFCGLQTILLNNIVADNIGDGVQCGGGVAEGNIVAANQGRGFAMGGALTGNKIDNNYSYGIDGPGGINATGYANNMLYLNGVIAGVANVTDATQMHPNSCNPACP